MSFSASCNRQSPKQTATAKGAAPCTSGDAARWTECFGEIKTLRDSGQPEKSLELSISACDSKLFRGCSQAAVSFHLGRGARADLKQAIAFAKRGCAADESLGCSLLSDYSYEAKDFAMALDAAKKGCSLPKGGDGCAQLAILYEEGQLVAKDQRQAFQLTTKACEMNSDTGCNQLARYYINGVGTPVDKKKGVGAAEKGCSFDHAAESCLTAGNAYYQGRVVNQDRRRALSFYETGCEQNQPEACLDVGGLYYDGSAGTRDLVKAKSFFEKSCRLGNESACANMKHWDTAAQTAHSSETKGPTEESASKTAVSDLEAAADAAQRKRERQLRKYHMTDTQNVLDDCVAKAGGIVLSKEFNFGTDVDIAYKIQLGDDALAQRFITYVEKASSCTSYSTRQIMRATIPALGMVRNTNELGTLIGTAGDLCASKAENNYECLASTMRAFVDIGRQ